MLDGLLQQARHETHHVPAIFAIALPLTCVSPVFAHFQKKKKYIPVTRADDSNLLLVCDHNATESPRTWCTTSKETKRG